MEHPIQHLVVSHRPAVVQKGLRYVSGRKGKEAVWSGAGMEQDGLIHAQASDGQFDRRFKRTADAARCGKS
jgi:hypothetical protein